MLAKVLGAPPSIPLLNSAAESGSSYLALLFVYQVLIGCGSVCALDNPSRVLTLKQSSRGEGSYASQGIWGISKCSSTWFCG